MQKQAASFACHRNGAMAFYARGLTTIAARTVRPGHALWDVPSRIHPVRKPTDFVTRVASSRRCMTDCGIESNASDADKSQALAFVIHSSVICTSLAHHLDNDRAATASHGLLRQASESTAAGASHSNLARRMDTDLLEKVGTDPASDHERMSLLS